MIHLPRCPRVAPGVSIAKRAIWVPVCLALGKNAKLQYEFSQHLIFGIVYEYQLSTRTMLINNMINLQLIFRY